MAAHKDFAEATNINGRLIEATNFVLDFWWLWPLVVVGFWLVMRLRDYHTMLGSLDERCEAAFADIDAMLAERHALVANLAETVKGFAIQEHKVLSDVIDARARAVSSAGTARLEAETQIGQSLTSLFAITENYPALASSTHFRDLRIELTRIEDRITAARRFYNLAVEELNSLRRGFPGNLIAGLTPIGRHEKFTLAERRGELAEPVKLSF